MHEHWLAQAHNAEASGLALAAQRNGVGDTDAWAATVLAAAQAQGFDSPAGVLLAAKLIGFLPRPGSIAEIRQLAVEFAAHAARATAPTSNVPAWSDTAIGDAVDALAQRSGITRPTTIALMKDVLLRPALTNAQRSERLGQSEGIIGNNVTFIRNSLGLPKGNLRVQLARLVGMPLSAVAARVGIEGDPQIGSRVIERINPGHRERVAEQLLSASPGSNIEVGVYRMLDTMFTTDPLVGDQARSGAGPFLVRAFAKDRIEMLRMMGFSVEQVLRMNPVGRELSSRMDPALGTYSAAETTARQAKGLPITREEAALRLLTARSASGLELRYRTWVALGLISDRPWSMPRDLNDAYLSVSPQGSLTAGQTDANLAFRVAENLRERQIPRGGQPDLIDRSYREDINRLLLQTFGLGAARVGSGRLESIPTTFEPRDRPSPNSPADTPLQREPRDPQESHPIGWEELLPLLQRPLQR
jgi:hypothetical protein